MLNDPTPPRRAADRDDLRPVETIPANESAMDYRQHETTWAAFTHVLKWFCVHMAFDLVGLYFFIIEGNPIVGAAFVAIGTAVVISGTLMAPRAAEEAPIVEPRPAPRSNRTEVRARH